MFGGAHRGNDFSGIATPAVASLAAMKFPALHGEMLGPPLEIQYGRQAMITRTDTMTTLAVVYRDSVIWRYSFPAGEHPMAGLAADSAGVLYSISTRGTLRAFGADGKPIWEKETQKDVPADRFIIPAPLLAVSDGVIVGNSFGRIMRFTREGEKRWSVQRGGAVDAPPAADPALGLVVAVTHNDYDRPDTLLLLDPATGTQRWATPLAEGRILSGPVIAGGRIVLGGATRLPSDQRAPFAAGFGLDGRQQWRTPLPLMPRGIGTDNAGNSYIACSGTAQEGTGGALVALDTLGKKRWEVTLESGLPAAPSVSADWVYFISRREGRTGIFTYGRDGTFHSFVSINILPDVHAQTTISSFGEVILAGLDQAVLLRGGN